MESSRQPAIGYCETCDEMVTWQTIELHPALGGHVVTTWERNYDE